MPEELLRVSNLSKAFGGVDAIVDLSFELHDHAIVSIIGPNGAGKTTLLNILSGFLRPDHGQLLYRGRSVGSLRPDEINALGVVRTFQLPRAFASLSVLENLLTFGPNQPGELPSRAVVRTQLARQRERQLINNATEIASRLNLSSVLYDPAIALSGGQKKLLDLGRALMSAPQLILLDEPVSGVNPVLSETIASVVKDLSLEGYRFVIVEHNMNFVRTISDDVIVLAEGRILARGLFREVIDNVHVQEAYLGGPRRYS